MRFLMTLVAVSTILASSPTDPASVLVVVQDNSGPEAGTGATNASQWVADHYMSARGIPAGNIVHVSSYVENGQGVSCSPGQATCDLAHLASTNITYQHYLDAVETPIKNKLAANSGALASTIKYIVPVYGVPITIQSRTVNGSTVLATSIDGEIGCLNQTRQTFSCTNPYWEQDPLVMPVHIDVFAPATAPYYIVTRLDGPTAALAAGLADKAIAAEASGVNRRAGIGYFDWQGLGNSGNFGQTSNLTADYSMYVASTLCTSAGLTCSLNNQSNTGGALIASAPNALWAWGWYSSTAVNDVYTFANGAIGAQLTSYTANFIRRQGTGSWVPFWITKGITATWGNTNEPGGPQRSINTYGDTLLNHFWRGYTFGESYAIGTQHNGWMSIGIGDPLYRPDFVGPTRIKGTFRGGVH